MPSFNPEKIVQFGVEYANSKGGKNILLWTNYAMMRAEQQGLSPSSGGITNTILTLWALLLYRNPKLTVEEAAEFLDQEQAAGRLDALNAACLEAMRKAGAVKEEQPSSPSEPPAAA